MSHSAVLSGGVAVMPVFLASGIFWREFSVNLASKFFASRCRLFGGGEKPYIVHHASEVDASAPKSALPFEADTYESRGIVFLSRLVNAIFSAVHRAKIQDSVVISHAVDVVQCESGPIAMKMTPRNAVRADGRQALETDVPVAATRHGTSLGSGVLGVPLASDIGAGPPRQNSRFGIVRQNAANEIDRKLGIRKLHPERLPDCLSEPVMAASRLQQILMEK